MLQTWFPRHFNEKIKLIIMKNKSQQKTTILSTLNFLERAGYYGLQSFFIFYFIQTKNIEEVEGYTLFGLYYGLIFLFTSFSAYIINKTKNPLFLYKVSFCLAPIGLLLFLSDSQFIHLAGMSLIIFATSFFRVIVPLLVGEFCDFKQNVDRNALFRKMYIHMNIGVFLSPIITGWISIFYGWVGAIFFITFLYIAGATLICFRSSDIFVEKRDDKNRLNNFKSLFLVMLSILFILFSLLNEKMYNYLFFFVILGVVSILVFLYIQASEAERVGLKLINSMIFFFFLFVGFYEQHGSSINVFILQHIDRKFFTFEIPVNFYQSISPLILVICGVYINKIFSFKKMERVNANVFLKSMIGFFLFAMAYFFFYKMASGVVSRAFASTYFLVLGLFFIAMGEIVFFPVVSSFITKFSPKNMKTLYLSLINITASSSIFLTSILGKLTTKDLNGDTHVVDSYSQVFGLIMFSCVLLASLSFFVARRYIFVNKNK
ncbi:MAG: hypothetical protein KA477_00050 [Candidatus Levybacteria bacterium]|jgi:POT family proton-dependent oligopeptide transporter|nr:hypothetical protein [Candidatus Levybacteria bacterium]